MKKLLSAILMFSVLASNTVSYARLTVTGPNIEKHESWLNEMQADTGVHNILDGNIAFVHNSQKAWVYDKVIELSAPAEYIYDEEAFEIPVSDANAIFGLSETGDTVSSKKIASRTSLNCFIDPRGFVVFGKEASVDTSVPANYSHYKDFAVVPAAMSFIDWEDVEFTEDEYAAYIKKWKGALTIPEGKEEEYKDFANGCISEAIATSKKVTPDGKGGYNFEGIVLDGYDLTGAQLAKFKTSVADAYTMLGKMARGYVCMQDKTTTEAVALKDKILGGLDHVLKYYSQGWNYSLDSKQSWVTTQYNIPFSCSNILCLMYDEMTDEERIKHTNQLFDKHPIPDVRTAGKNNNRETYTNLLWRCFSYFNIAVIAKDTYRMNYAMKYASPAFLYAARNNGFNDLVFGKDGFYHDGSMIFHNHTPYNMGYGMSYAGLVNEYQELTRDTKFDIRKIYSFDNVYDFCIKHFIPFTSNGMTMRMAHGRASTNGDTAILRQCAYIAINAPEEKRNEIISAIKGVMGDRAVPVGSMSYELNVPTLTEMNKRYKEYADKVPASASNNSSTVYYNQDEVIHKSDKFTATLQMSSSRVAKYEAIPPTNSTGWYLGDGMLYVYTDGKQYGTEYFNKVNPYYMPGTTVDSTPRTAINTSTSKTWGLPDNDWAGGVTDGKNTSASYIMGNQYVSGLEGKKSYFMIGDKIVCIGTGIKNGMGEVYTVVENRMIDEESEDIKPIEVGYEPKNILTGNEEDEESAWLTIDGSINTSLPLGAIGEYIIYDFGEKVNIGKIGMAFLYGDKRKELATIQVSDDGVNFTDVCDFESTGTSTDIDLYDLNCSGRYVKIISRGNEKNAYFNLSEIIFYKDTATVEEIEESRVIITEGFEDIVVDGEVQEPVFNKTHPVTNPGWVWLENQQGYVFLEEAQLDIIRERQPSSPVFMKMCIMHGEKPQSAQYAYVQLPKATKAETEAFSKNPDIEIVRMDDDVHAVFDKKQNVMYANIFRKNIVFDGIRFENACSVIINRNSSKIYVSDPSWTSDKISFTVPDEWSVTKGTNTSVNGNTVVIDSSVRRGDVHTVSYKAGNEQNNNVVKVMDYNLTISDTHFVTTSLYASSPAGDVTFTISESPTFGRASIDGNILYYSPSKGLMPDKFTVEAKDSAGNSAVFNVTVSKN